MPSKRTGMALQRLKRAWTWDSVGEAVLRAGIALKTGMRRATNK